MRKFWKRMRFMLQIRKFVPFLTEFFVSKEVKGLNKLLAVGFMIGYICFPFDLIPDVLTFFGILDDVTVFVFIVHRIFHMAPPEMRQKYDIL